MLATSVLGALGVVVFSSWPSVAQWAGGGSEVNANIISSTRLEATVSTDPDTTLSVSGPNGATLDVRIPGTVALSNDTLAALNGRLCVPGGQGKVGVAGTASGVPPVPGDGGTGAFPGRTSISVVLSDGTGFVSCMASGLDGGSPVCTFPAAGAQTDGFLVDQGGSAVMEVSEAYVLRCIHCTSNGSTSGSTAIVSYVEMDCNQ